MLRTLASTACLAALSTAASANDLATSFEFSDQTGLFSLGTPPQSATFIGGEAKTIGNFDLYHSGIFSWMIVPGNTGEIVFQTGAESVDLFVRDEAATVGGVLTVFGTDGGVITTVNVTNVSWTQVTVGSANQPVGRITLENNGTTFHTVIDDLTYCALGNVGASYCGPAVANSTGQPGVIEATGSLDVSLNALTLTGTQLPMGEFGYFIVSQNQGFVMPPASQGFLCLAGPIGRHNAQLQNSGADGIISIIVDLQNLPFAPPISVQSGETWNWQLWYRDKNPTPTSNFTDGVSVTFL